MKIGKYIATTATVIIALYAVFFGLSAILATVGSVSWDDVWNWSGKIGIVAGILLVINVVIAALIGLLPKPVDNDPAKRK